MAGASVSEMILFIASILVAAAVAGVFIDTVGGLSHSIESQGDATSRSVATDVEIISDAGSQVYDMDGNGNISLYVKNTGSRELDAEGSNVEVIVNGTYVGDVAVTPVDGSGWPRGGVVELEIDQSLESDAEHRVKIVVNGDSEVFRFRT
jgi:flagellar protein FlaG